MVEFSGGQPLTSGAEAPATTAALRLSGFHKVFGSTTAVDHLDLVVPSGSFFGLVGPNGAGKTTALSMAVGLLRPDGGQASVFGRDVWTDPARAKSLVGVLLAVVLPLVTGTSEAFAWVFGLLPVMLGAGAGLVLLMSVFTAFPLPDQRTNSNPFSAGGRPGCARAALQLAITGLLVLVAISPAVLLITGSVTGNELLRWSAVPVGLAVGAVTYWWWGELAIDRLRARGPELLAEVGRTP